MNRPWVAVLASGIGVSMSISPAFLTVSGLYMVPMTRDLGWTRTDFTLGISLVSLVAVLTTPFAGVFIDRIGARPLAIAASIALPLCLFAQSLLGPSHVPFLALSTVIGMVAAIASPLIFVSVVPQWVEHKLGLAIALAMTGLGLGQVFWSVASPRLIDTLGWRGSWRWSAVILLAIAFPNAVLLFREGGDTRSVRKAPPHAGMSEGVAFATALRSPTYCLAGIAIMLVSLVGAGLAMHIVPLLTDDGMGRSRGALALSALATGSLCGRLITGYLLDRIRFGIVGAMLFAGQSAGLLLLLSCGVGSAAVFVAAFLVGTALGAEADLMPFLIRRRFGMRAFGKLFGILFALYQMGAVIGPWLLSRSYDRLGSYTPMLFAFASISAVGAVLIALTDEGQNAPALVSAQ